MRSRLTAISRTSASRIRPQSNLPMLKAVHAQEDREAARAKATLVVAKLREMRLGQAAALVEAGIEETFSYHAFPSEHWRSIRTNNPQERIMREIRRRTRAWARFQTSVRPSCWWRRGSATSPAASVASAVTSILSVSRRWPWARPEARTNERKQPPYKEKRWS